MDLFETVILMIVIVMIVVVVVGIGFEGATRSRTLISYTTGVASSHTASLIPRFLMNLLDSQLSTELVKCSSTALLSRTG